MYAVEFETDIKSEYIKVPEYSKLKNKHAKIYFIFEDKSVDDKKDMGKDLLNEFYTHPIIIDDFTMPTREERNER